MPRNRSIDVALRRIVDEHLDALVSEVTEAVRQGLVRDLEAFLGERGTVRLAAPRRVLGCIAPGCTNPSKGPRFHYLCEKHKGAAKKDYEAWRKARLAAERR